MGNAQLNPEDSPKWIVIINRMPKGPLEREEIVALIDEGIIRRNDLACLVLESKSEKSEWKFLWQFPDFDRRITENREVSPELAASREEERRQLASVVELTRKKSTLLPEELASIRPEDLIFRATSSSASGDVTAAEMEERNLARTEKTTSGSLKWIISLLILGGITFLGMKMSGPQKVTQTAIKNRTLPLTRAPELARIPANSPNTPPRRIQQPMPVHKPEIKVPEPRDQGDIGYEEYRRKRDQELERERQKEEDDRNREVEKEDEQNDENSSRSKKKVKEESKDEEKTNSTDEEESKDESSNEE